MTDRLPDAPLNVSEETARRCRRGVLTLVEIIGSDDPDLSLSLIASWTFAELAGRAGPSEATRIVHTICERITNALPANDTGGGES